MKGNNDTKQRLVDATRQMIDSSGIDSVSMREIGKKVQLSRSAVYRHFNNKEDLLAAIAVENFRFLKKSIYGLIDEIDEPVKILDAILKHYYNFGIRNREHYRLMFGYEWNKEQYPDVYNTAFEIYGIVSTCIVKAQEQNLITSKSAKELTAVAFSFIHGLIELKYAGHDETEKGLNNADILIDLFLDVLKVA